MRRRLIVVLVLVVVAGGGFAWWWYGNNTAATNEVVLYGNVELRQVELAFMDSGRIAEVAVEEGDAVKQGDVVARLDTSRLVPQLAQARAQVAAQAAVVDKLKAGSRPEEIEQAQASVAAAKADADNADANFKRVSSLAGSAGNSIVTASQLDAALAGKRTAAARLQAANAALDLAAAGARAEDIAQAEAQLQASQAQLALLERQRADAELTSPIDAVVRSRLLEPGEMASPQRPVVSLAIVDPKWVRAYVSEPDLVKVKPGAEASVTVDGLADQTFVGHVGFISPVAEFTPRSIQTEELRTSLVYEVRVLVTDAGNALRLGMPATVRLMPNETSAAAGDAP